MWQGYIKIERKGRGIQPKLDKQGKAQQLEGMAPKHLEASKPIYNNTTQANTNAYNCPDRKIKAQNLLKT